MKNIIYHTLLFSLFLISCDMETVIDLDIPSHEPVLVLNGLLDTDTNARVVISHSVGAFSSGRPSFINNANVLLYKNNQFIDSLLLDMTDEIYVYYSDTDSLAMYYYKSDYKPIKDANYRVEVDHSDYPSISAETYIPNDITLYNINVDTTSSEDKIGLTFSFDDNSSQQNYYRLKVFSSCTKVLDDDGEEWSFSGDAYMMSNDLSFPQDIPWEGYAFSGHRVVFSDALFNGQQKTITLDVGPGLKHDYYLNYIDCDTLIIEFSTFSDDTYSYYNSLGDYLEKGELGLFGGEVIPVYSNVENGLGVLISTNAQQIYLKPSFK